MNGYIWYSSGSDVTGPALAQRLGFSSGNKTPDFTKFEVVVGWGCKAGTKYNADTLKALVEQRKLRLLNPVEEIQATRDKVGMLSRLQQGGIPVPGFLVRNEAPKAFLGLAEKAVRDGQLLFPLVGTTKGHKGTPVFCYTMDDLALALNGPDAEQIEYLRSFCPGTEYRIHVLRDTVLFAQVKTLAKNPEEAYAETLEEKLQREFKALAKEGKAPLFQMPSKNALQWITKTLAGELMSGPAQVQRSLGRGWALEEFKKIPPKAAQLAIKALDLLGLDLGAVSVEVDGEACRVTGVATAPGLDEKQLDIYSSAIKDAFKVKAPEPKPKAKAAAVSVEEEAPVELLAALTRRLRDVSKDKLEAALKLLGE